MKLSVVKGAEQTVGDRIREIREEKDMTQLDLAKRLGVSRAAVGQWEINATSPSIAKLEEVARVLDVAPEFLAYNVIPGEPKIVYRNPEREDIVWVTDVTFDTGPADMKEGRKWGFPSEFLRGELRANPEKCVLTQVDSHAVEPEYEYGDRVIIDTSDKRPTPAGVFLYWDGVGAAYARMQIIPKKDAPLVRITAKGADAMEMPLDEVEIIGRVKGRVQRG